MEHDLLSFLTVINELQLVYEGSSWTGVYPPPPELTFLIKEKCFPKTGSLSP